MVRPKEQCQDYIEIQSWPFHYRQILLEKEAIIRLVIDFNKLKLQTCPRMVTSLFFMSSQWTCSNQHRRIKIVSMEEDNTPSEEEAPSSKKGEAKRVTTCHHPMSSGFRKDYSVVLVSNSAPKALRTKKDVLHRVPINADSKPPIPLFPRFGCCCSTKNGVMLECKENHFCLKGFKATY